MDPWNAKTAPWNINNINSNKITKIKNRVNQCQSKPRFSKSLSHFVQESQCNVEDFNAFAFSWMDYVSFFNRQKFGVYYFNGQSFSFESNSRTSVEYTLPNCLPKNLVILYLNVP